MINLDVISFFAFVLILSSFLLAILWNCSFRKTKVPVMSVKTGMTFTAAWFFFSTMFLVLLESARNFLSPGLWEKELLFTGLKQTSMAPDRAVWSDLLFGWFLYPRRILPLVEYDMLGIMTGLTVLTAVLFLVELTGMIIGRTKWQFRWGMTIPAAFILLYVISYSSVGLVRQIGWLITSRF